MESWGQLLFLHLSYFFFATLGERGVEQSRSPTKNDHGRRSSEIKNHCNLIQPSSYFISLQGNGFKVSLISWALAGHLFHLAAALIVGTQFTLSHNKSVFHSNKQQESQKYG